MFNVDDRVRVVTDEFNRDVINKVGTVTFVEGDNVLVVLDDDTPTEFDLFMASLLQVPAGSIPFIASELEHV